MRHRNSKKRAFTIVELLTVMGVIALLIGLLVPALNMVRKQAKDTKQRAQFNSIKAGLEMFRTDNGDYPESTAMGAAGTTHNLAVAEVTTGAQHLAEALLGRDLQGFDTLSTGNASVDDAGADAQKIYANTVSRGSSTTEVTDSLARRKGPYLDLEGVGAFSINQLYPSSYATGNVYGVANTATPASDKPSPFITDVFADRTVTVTYTSAGVTTSVNLKAGTPVLYYRANATNKDLRKTTPPATGYTDRTYNYYDNKAIMDMGKMMTQSTPPVTTTTDPGFHPLADITNNYLKFYEAITNHQIPNDEGVAYRADTYILMSAGRDGLFGTADDIYNFGEKTQ
ncbi:MAG: hypothetical protein Q7T18_12450 [Sedimentisphaerales bacterium]|nr:hypothetical protein [Sedimentisphaerales bacterium]